MIFTLNAIHQMSQTFLIQQNIFVLTVSYFSTFSFSLCFFILTILSTKNEYIFGFNSTNSLIVPLPVSSLILPTTNLFEL